MIDQIVVWLNANEGVAAWLQTIGSLIALCIAIWFPIQQRMSAEKDRKGEAAERNYVQINFIWGSLNSLVEELCWLREKASLELEPIERKSLYRPSALKNILDGFDAFPLHGLSTGPAVMSAILSRRKAHEVAADFDEVMTAAFAASIPGYEIDFGEFDEQLSDLADHRDKWAELRSLALKKRYMIK